MSKHEDNELGPEELEKGTQVVSKSYDEAATESPELEDVDDEDGGGYRSLSGSADAASDMTDMQAAMLMLNPELGTAEQRAMMVSRISPEMFLPLLHGITTDEVMRSDPEKSLDHETIKIKNYALLSIGLDGMGRIDIAELQGAARDTAIASKASGFGV